MGWRSQNPCSLRDGVSHGQTEGGITARHCLSPQVPRVTGGEGPRPRARVSSIAAITRGHGLARGQTLEPS